MDDTNQSVQNNSYPTAYKEGHILFCGLEIDVDENVLIPRIETEKMVDMVEKYIEETATDRSISVLDVGTGSGCISIALARRFSNISVIAIDISDEILEVAKKNAKKHDVEDKIKFIKNDLLSNYCTKHDIIVSNLPYIPTKEIINLDDSVKNFEPLLALDGGGDGFELYRRLFAQIVEGDINPKLIVIEFNDTHDKLALTEGKKYFPNHNVNTEKDKYGYYRFLVITSQNNC